MMKRIFASGAAALVCAGMALIGCSNVNGPDSAQDGKQTTISESFDVTTLASQTILLKSSGIDTDSANAFFTLRWSEGLKHFQSSDTVMGHASAVAYEQPATLRDRNAFGLDMGTVSVTTGQDTFDLLKFISSSLGVRYGMFGGLTGSRGRCGGLQGSRDGNGGHHGGWHGRHGGRGYDLEIVNIPFVGSSTYQFTASGTDSISAFTVDIQSPSQLLEITAPANKDTVDTTQALTVTWAGDPTATNTVLVLAPGKRHGRSQGDSTTVSAILINVDATAGTYTIPAQTLQDLLSQSNVTSLSLHLSQGNVKQLTDAQLGKVLVSAGSDDQVTLKIK
jgi:hypothetical protein